MEKYFVKIDLNSIKKNENAGTMQTMEHTGTTIIFKTNKLPKNFKDGENCVILRYSVHESECFEGLITDENLVHEVIEKKPDGVEINIKHHYNTIKHLPIPEYSYIYENIQIKCGKCEAEMMINELVYEEIYNDYDNYSYTVCPKCREWDCIKAEYEKINEALKRVNVIQKL